MNPEFIAIQNIVNAQNQSSIVQRDDSHFYVVIAFLSLFILNFGK